jgi:zinc protease
MPLFAAPNMSKYTSFTLANGLRCFILPDPGNPMAVLNLMYDVGSRDEDPQQTGFAHLFEHLMFGGSVNIPEYDEPLQRVGGENNAFTNTDITNYYIQLPKENLETAFWLESDRMLSLAFSQKSLDVQIGVVIEEFKQRYLNQPYGDAMHLLRELAYKVHPYQWPTIGKELSHIAEARLEDVRNFFFRYYRPGNAVLVVAGDLEVEKVRELAETWFGPIDPAPKWERQLPSEPAQTESRRTEVKAPVPMAALYKAFPMAGRVSKEFYEANLLTDLLGHGKSSRLVNTLVKEERIFHSFQCYVTGSTDPGMLIMDGKLNPGQSVEAAEARLWKELQELQANGFGPEEIEKVRNQSETALAGGEVEILNRAINLAYFSLLGNPEDFDQELKKIQEVTAEGILDCFRRLITPGRENTVVYIPENSEPDAEA